MLYKDVCRIVGVFILSFSATFLVPLALAIYFEFYLDPSYHPQPHSTFAFLISFFITLSSGIGLWFFGRKSSGHMYRREGLAIVVMIWFLIPGFAALPFYLSGTLQNPIKAYFEAVSGFTTTGATVMQGKEYNPETGKEIPIVTTIEGPKTTTYSFYGTITPIRNSTTGEVITEGIEAVSKALLFWRSLIQWIGGSGIIVLFVAILPALGVGGRLLVHAEVPGPIKDSLTPRIKETAIHLWKIYLALTALEIVMLMWTNDSMEWIDAVTITLSTISTGGFSIRNASIAYYQNSVTENIVILFMILGSINFSHYFFCLRGKVYKVFEPEFLLFLSLLILTCLIASYNLTGSQMQSLTESHPTGTYTQASGFRAAVFQIVSAMTSTGFATANYEIWPYMVQGLMLICMYIGGMSGSTAGGMKIMRHFMLFRIAQHKVESLFRPENVRSFRLGSREVTDDVAIMVLCFFLMCISIGVFGGFIFMLRGIDPQTALALISCTINNVGFSFRAAGPEASFCFLDNFNLLFSCFLMICGRLEFFAIFAMLVPAFWRQDS